MEVDYYAKYLKYKNKYTELKKQIGKGPIWDTLLDKKCKHLGTQATCKNNNNCFWGVIREQKINSCHPLSCNFTRDKEGNKVDRTRLSCVPHVSCTWGKDVSGKERCKIK